MKKSILLSSLILMTSFAFAQITTNTFPDDGNAGVGTTSPTEKLEVVGTVKSQKSDVDFNSSTTQRPLEISEINSLRKFYYGATSNGYSALKLFDSNGFGRFIMSVKDNDDSYFSLRTKNNSEGFKVGLDNSLGFFMHMPQANSRFVIGSTGGYLSSEGHKFIIKDGSAKVEGDLFSTGSIGIGTMSFIDGSDTYRLSVDGKIRAHGVRVYTDWADFVFEDNYNLPSLSEVENYIKENGHLKDIPSAKDVKDNGIELGEMNKLLLQKIEELTLYTIELKKEIDAIKNKQN